MLSAFLCRSLLMFTYILCPCARGYPNSCLPCAAPCPSSSGSAFRQILTAPPALRRGEQDQRVTEGFEGVKRVNQGGESGAVKRRRYCGQCAVLGLSVGQQELASSQDCSYLSHLRQFLVLSLLPEHRFVLFLSNCAMERKDLSFAMCTCGELVIQLPKAPIFPMDLLLGALFQSFPLKDLSDVTAALSISPWYFFSSSHTLNPKE